MIPLVILDRDGVISYDSADFIKSPEEWQPIPGSLRAIAKLKRHNIKVAIATNQSGIARGLFDKDMLDKIHAKMQNLLSEHQAIFDGIFYCPHGPLDNCSCRKPKSGMLEQIADKFKIDLKKQVVPCIGDSLRDLEAALTAGCRPILVLTGNGVDTANCLPPHLQHVERYADLSAACEQLIKETSTLK